jgi:hypothetical protein
MSDDPTPTTDNASDADEQASQSVETAATPDQTDTRQQMVRYSQWAAFAFLVLIALIATVRLYFAVSSSIDTFVTYRYRPLFMTGFNLAVLLGCGIGLSVLVRRMT